jgi:multidrug transporter EmrE-like cation transporter
MSDLIVGRTHAVSAASISLILAGVALNAAAQLLLKAGTNAIGRFEFTAANIVPVGARLAGEPHILTGMVCYVVSLVVWIMGLSRVEVSIAYPMLSLGYLINALAAWYLFGESVGPMRLLGIGFVVLGVYFIVRSA